MRRHPSLQPLSRFHRSVLFVALILKKNPPKVKGYPDSWEGKLVYLKEFYKEKLSKHFLKFEEQLIPSIQVSSEKLEKLSNQVLESQTNIAGRIMNLDLNIQLINELGVELEKHVRMVEREYFQEVQRLLSEDEINQIEIK